MYCFVDEKNKQKRSNIATYGLITALFYYC
nr:MAG TPA: hypothetical protein [Caudoviricetes sp.]